MIMGKKFIKKSIKKKQEKYFFFVSTLFTILCNIPDSNYKYIAVNIIKNNLFPPIFFIAL